MFSVSNNYAEYESQESQESQDGVKTQDLDERNQRILEIAMEKNYKILDSDADSDNQYFYDMETKIVYEVWPLDEYENCDEDYINQIKKPTFERVMNKSEMNHLLTLNAII